MKIKSLFPLIQDTSNQMINYLQQQCKHNNNLELNARELSTKFTGNVTASCIYGFDGKSFTNNANDSVICKMGVALLRATKRIIIFSSITGALPFITKFYKLTYIKRPIYDFFYGITKTSVELRLKTKSNQTDFIEFLLQLKEKRNISVVEMAAHALTFFFNAFETSGFGLAMTLYQLAKHPVVQKRLRQEIVDNLNESLNYENISDLPYLEAVLAEGFRIYPPVSNLVKICTAETELPGIKGHNLKIEKGMVVLIPVYEIHHNSDYYENPEFFNPDRFMPENGGVKKYEENCMYLAFGAGPRVCIGKKFAKTQLKHALASIVRHFELTVSEKMNEDIRFDPNQFILQPINGLWVNLKKIDVE